MKPFLPPIDPKKPAADASGQPAAAVVRLSQSKPVEKGRYRVFGRQSVRADLRRSRVQLRLRASPQACQLGKLFGPSSRSRGIALINAVEALAAFRCVRLDNLDRVNVRPQRVARNAVKPLSNQDKLVRHLAGLNHSRNSALRAAKAICQFLLIARQLQALAQRFKSGECLRHVAKNMRKIITVNSKFMNNRIFYELS